MKASSAGSQLMSNKQPNPAVTEIIEVPEPFANAMRIGDCYSVAAPLAYDRSPDARKKMGKVGP